MPTEALLQPVRLVFVLNSLEGGGAERVLTGVLAGLSQERRFEVMLVLLDDLPRAYAPPADIIVHQLNSHGSLIRSFIGLWRLARTVRPAALAAFLTRANLATVLVAKSLGVPCLISERVHTSSHLSAGVYGRLARALINLVYPLADRIVAVSRGIAQDLSRNYGVPADRIRVIPNPAPQPPTGPAARKLPMVNGPYLVSAGRLSPQKNFRLLIEAFARARTQSDLVILGEGPERADLAGLIAELGLEDRVHLPGFVKDPYPIIAGANAYVLSSRYEGCPNGVLEALSLGVPVVANNCPTGPWEILCGGRERPFEGVLEAEYGLLTAAGDALALSSAIDRIERDSVNTHYRTKARVRASMFTADNAKQLYARELDMLIQRRPSAGRRQRRPV